MDKTFIGVKELAASINVSEKTIYRMLNDDQLPFAVKIGGQWRFRRDAVDSWIANQAKGESESGKVNAKLSIAEALQNGTVMFRIHGRNRDEALDSLLEALPHNSSLDLHKIKLSVLMRESLASSCLDRISCMTTAAESPVYTDKSLVILAFLEEEADFKALDGLFAQAIFLIIGANSGEQALLETRLRRLLMERRFRVDILAQPGRQELIQLFKDRESKLFQGLRK